VLIDKSEIDKVCLVSKWKQKVCIITRIIQADQGTIVLSCLVFYEKIAKIKVIFQFPSNTISNRECEGPIAAC